jgi:hypothetical protein
MTPILVCCSNSIQFQKIQEFLKTLQNISFTGKFQRVFVYIDEVHESFKMAEETFQKFENLSSVCKIYGLTATPDTFFYKVSKFADDNFDEGKTEKQKIAEFKNQLDNYMFFDDYEFENVHLNSGHMHIDPDIVEKNPNKYAMRIMSNPVYYNDFFAPGKYTFVPSMFHTKYHSQMKDFILSKSDKAVVFVLNGSEKKMFYQKERIVYEQDIYQDNEVIEFSDKMLILLDRYDLREKRSYFVTGYNCISLGITLCNPTIGHFTGSIIYHLQFDENNGQRELDNLYQISARTAGFMKHWKSFEKFGKTKLFCPAWMFHFIKKTEESTVFYFRKKIEMISRLQPRAESSNPGEIQPRIESHELVDIPVSVVLRDEHQEMVWVLKLLLNLIYIKFIKIYLISWNLLTMKSRWGARDA